MRVYLVSDSCLLSATSASNRSTATEGPEIEFPMIIPAVGTNTCGSHLMLGLGGKG
jgi:hypothetical protein